MSVHSYVITHKDIHILGSVRIRQDLYLALNNRPQKLSGLNNLIFFFFLFQTRCFQKLERDLALPFSTRSLAQIWLSYGCRMTYYIYSHHICIMVRKTGKGDIDKGVLSQILLPSPTQQFVLIFYWQELGPMATSICREG